MQYSMQIVLQESFMTRKTEKPVSGAFLPIPNSISLFLILIHNLQSQSPILIFNPDFKSPISPSQSQILIPIIQSNSPISVQSPNPHSKSLILTVNLQSQICNCQCLIRNKNFQSPIPKTNWIPNPQSVNTNHQCLIQIINHNPQSSILVPNPIHIPNP